MSIAAKTSFIDYEYGAFNFKAFDIGNHFCEYLGECFNFYSNDKMVMLGLIQIDMLILYEQQYLISKT